MVTILQRDEDIIIIPRDWWKDNAESLEPEDLGWWYTVNKPVKFHEYRVCTKRRGDDLDEETRVIHSKEYRGYDEILQEPTKKGGKWENSGEGETIYDEEKTDTGSEVSRATLQVTSRGVRKLHSHHR
jgi:hypothetical protein